MGIGATRSTVTSAATNSSRSRAPARINDIITFFRALQVE
jgi:hypothetical protein